MDAAEVIEYEVQRDGVRVVLDLLAERVGQSRESTNRHSHRNVLALDVAGRDLRHFRVADDPLFLDTDG